MAIAADRAETGCIDAKQHGLGWVLMPFLHLVTLGLLLQLPWRIVLDWLRIVPSNLVLFIPSMLGLVIATFLAARRFPSVIRDARRPASEIFPKTVILEAARHRPPERICPLCGGDPFSDRPCCADRPSSWSPNELHAFWFDCAHPPNDAKGSRGMRLRQRMELSRIFDLQRGRQSETLGNRRRPMLTTCSYHTRLTLGFLVVGSLLIVWFLESTLYGLGAFWMAIGFTFWGILHLMRNFVDRILPELGWSRARWNGDTSLQPTCCACEHAIDANRTDRCPECGIDFEEFPPNFLHALSPPPRINLIRWSMTGLMALPFLLYVVGSDALPVSTILPMSHDEYALVSNKRLVDLMARPRSDRDVYRTQRALKIRSLQFQPEDWDHLARTVSGPALWVGRYPGALNPWATEILKGNFPRTVDDEVLASLDRHLWEPAFHIEALTEERSSITWTARNRSDRLHLVVVEMRIDGIPIPLPEPRSWLKADRADMEIPYSADRLRSAEIEMDLILFNYQRSNPTTRTPEYQRAVSEARRSGSPPPITPLEMPVEFDDAGDPILIPHTWRRSLHRTVTTPSTE